MAAASEAHAATSPQPAHLGLLRLLLAASIASTAVHYSHNFVAAGQYPTLPPLFPSELAFRIGIAIAWPLLTAVGLWGYREYANGHLRRAGWAFIAYSVLGGSTLGHFLGATPEIPAFFFLTIFTDFITGTAMLAFGAMAIVTAASEPRAS
jgi:hypothetical protein